MNYSYAKTISALFILACCITVSEIVLSNDASEIEKSISERIEYSGYLISTDKSKSSAIIKEDISSFRPVYRVYKIGDSIPHPLFRGSYKFTIKDINPNHITLEYAKLVYQDDSSHFVSKLVLKIKYSGNGNNELDQLEKGEFFIGANKVSLFSYMDAYLKGTTILGRTVYQRSDISIKPIKTRNVTSIISETLSDKNIKLINISDNLVLVDNIPNPRTEIIPELKKRYCHYQNKQETLRVNFSDAHISTVIDATTRLFTKKVDLVNDLKYRITIIGNDDVLPCDLFVGIIYAYRLKVKNEGNRLIIHNNT